MSINYETGLDVGTQKRRQDGINEDSIAVNVLEDGHLDTDRSAGVFVLADGAGGEEAGEIASYVATVEITRRLTQTLWDDWRLETLLDDEMAAGRDRELDEAMATDPLAEREPSWVLNRIETAIQSTHTRILQTVRELGLESAYTTVVVAVKIADRLYVGWVGDSRAYVINRHPARSDGQRICLLTRDHSVVEGLVQRGEIDEVEAHVHREGNRITRALGGSRTESPTESTVQVETRHVRVFDDDVILLTSDGLIDAYVDAPLLHDEYKQSSDTSDIEAEILEKSVTDDEIGERVMDTRSLEDAVGRLLTLANRRGGKDNLSLVLFQDETLDPSPVEEFPDRGYRPHSGDRTD